MNSFIFHCKFTACSQMRCKNKAGLLLLLVCDFHGSIWLYGWLYRKSRAAFELSVLQALVERYINNMRRSTTCIFLNISFESLYIEVKI